MSALIVLISMLGFIVYLYFKGTLAKSLIMIFMLIFAVVVAFGFFEQLSELFISRTRSSLADYSQPLILLLLFVLAFSVFHIISTFILKKHVMFDPLAEKIGRVLFGAISGIIFAGVIVTVLDLSSISKNHLYDRFDQNTPDIQNPGKAFLNADGLVTGLFSIFSKGGLSSDNSFALVHPEFINEVYLNYLAKDKKVKILTSKPAIKIDNEAPAWLAPDSLVDSEGNNLTAESGHMLIIVRAGIKRNGTPFTLSQLRLICNQKNIENPLKGTGVNAYPIGYIDSSNNVILQQLSSIIEIEASAYKEGTAWMDFIYNVPDNYQPVVLVFKQNNAVKIPKLMDSPPPPEVKKELPEEEMPEEDTSKQNPQAQDT